MNRLLLFIFFLPFSMAAQQAGPGKAQLSRIYSQAIADFIKQAGKKNKSTFDTLFFGNRKNGQPDDFPDIDLPHKIGNTYIMLVSPEEVKRKQLQRPSRHYINLVGWADKEKAQFLFFVFSNGFEHRYNYNLNYRYSDKLKDFELIRSEFKGAPFDR